jgi:ribosomal protein S18 acetylase RimI-like enzyme
MSHNDAFVEEDIEEARQLGYCEDCEEQPQSHSSLEGGLISYRPFHPGDREQIQELHKEWFPVTYKDEFYDELVLERMVNTGEKLFTCAAVYHEEEEETQQAMINEDEYEDYIVACVVGSLLDVSRLDKDTVSLLISDPFRYKQVFYIMTLGTVTEFRNARIATSLVEKCIRIVENNRHCGALYLHVITFNTAAIRFYERLGFYRVKEIESKNSVCTGLVLECCIETCCSPVFCFRLLSNRREAT